MLHDAATPSPASLKAHSPPATILVADSNPAQADILSTQLVERGYGVLATPLDQQCLEIALHARPQLVVLNFHLPDSQGSSLHEALANTPETRAIPVIVLRQLPGPDVVRRPHTAGSVYYVRKPYDPPTLLSLIQNSLR